LTGWLWVIVLCNFTVTHQSWVEHIEIALTTTHDAL
jgi:hypothetical protein